MTKEERQFLADSYANAWMAVKGGNTTVEVLDNGWFAVRHSYIPGFVDKRRAGKLLKGLSILTGRLKDKKIEVTS